MRLATSDVVVKALVSMYICKRTTMDDNVFEPHKWKQLRTLIGSRAKRAVSELIINVTSLSGIMPPKAFNYYFGM